MNTPTTAEIVTFRLNPGVAPEIFTAAAERMTRFLRGTGAMVSRTLSADPDGLWTDHITWVSHDAALSAAEQMMAQPEAQSFIEMIAPDGVQMRHAAISLYLPPE
ncbi:MAG: hypothetical protein AAF999_03705 [Pseudomonadota bacterium]